MTEKRVPTSPRRRDKAKPAEPGTVRIAKADAMAIWRGLPPGPARDVIAAALDRDAPLWRMELGG
ncbi:MAG: hypothetical protein ACOCUS_03175 [Polyangiales bacterium]